VPGVAGGVENAEEYVRSSLIGVVGVIGASPTDVCVDVRGRSDGTPVAFRLASSSEIDSLGNGGTAGASELAAVGKGRGRLAAGAG